MRRANGAVAVLDTAPAIPPETRSLNVSLTSCVCEELSVSSSNKASSSTTMARIKSGSPSPSFPVIATSSMSSLHLRMCDRDSELAVAAEAAIASIPDLSILVSFGFIIQNFELCFAAQFMHTSHRAHRQHHMPPPSVAVVVIVSNQFTSYAMWHTRTNTKRRKKQTHGAGPTPTFLLL